MTEAQKVEKILEGNLLLFADFVSIYQDMAITIAFRICGNRQDAEDIAQESFIKAFHNLHTFQRKSKFSSWFYRIVYNTSLTFIRKRRSQKEYIDYQFADQQDVQEDWNVLNKMEETERKKIVNQAISQLHPSESIIITLYYMEDLPIKEIVRITKNSPSNVKVKLYRARKNLAKLLEKTKTQI